MCKLMHSLRTGLLLLATLLAGFIPFASQATTTCTAVTLIHQGSSDPTHTINLVYIPWGWGNDQVDFSRYVNESIGFLNMEPYSQYQSYINIYRVDCTSSLQSGDFSDTPSSIEAAALPFVPNVTRFILIRPKLGPASDINYAYYGGDVVLSTYDYALAAHELGHSLGSLADEYGSNNLGKACVVPTTEPSEPNVTINPNSATVKWNYWINAGVIGAPVQGGKYCDSGIWRPRASCIMRDALSTNTFDPVDREQLVRQFNTMVNPIASTSPIASQKAVTPQDTIAFSFLLDPDLRPQNASFTTPSWYVNNGFKSTGSTLTLNMSNYRPFDKVDVRAESKDPDINGFVRSDPGATMTHKKTWGLYVYDRYLPPYSVAGRVTDSKTGNGISGVAVNVTDGFGPVVGSAMTDTTGSYFISGLPPAASSFHRLLLTVPTGYQLAAGYSAAVVIGLSPVSEHYRSDYILVSPTYTLSGTVTDAVTGQRLAGATINVNFGAATATTDTNGNYVLTNLQNTDYYVRASKSGYLTSNAIVRINGANASQNFVLAK